MSTRSRRPSRRQLSLAERPVPLPVLFSLDTPAVTLTETVMTMRLQYGAVRVDDVSSPETLAAVTLYGKIDGVYALKNPTDIDLISDPDEPMLVEFTFDGVLDNGFVWEFSIDAGQHFLQTPAGGVPSSSVGTSQAASPSGLGWVSCSNLQDIL
jgi:hypothetical protein